MDFREWQHKHSCTHTQTYTDIHTHTHTHTHTHNHTHFIQTSFYRLNIINHKHCHVCLRKALHQAMDELLGEGFPAQLDEIVNDAGTNNPAALHQLSLFWQTASGTRRLHASPWCSLRCWQHAQRIYCTRNGNGDCVPGMHWHTVPLITLGVKE